MASEPNITAGSEAVGETDAASRENSASTAKIIAAIITVLLAVAAGGWGTYAIVQQRQAQASNPQRLIDQCKSSIRRIERTLSKHAA